MARTALHEATWNGERTRELIAEGYAGADVDPQDVRGNTPLLRVVGNHENSLATVTLFLEHGADPTTENNDSHSPVEDRQTATRHGDTGTRSRRSVGRLAKDSDELGTPDRAAPLCPHPGLAETPQDGRREGRLWRVEIRASRPAVEVSLG